MAERILTQTFVFVVTGAIIEKEGKFLLVKENRGKDAGKWNQPAGWVDVGENPVTAVMREVKEETGLDFEPTGILGIFSLVRKDREIEPGNMPHPIKLIFVGKIAGGEIAPSGKEISEVKWFTPEEIESMGRDTLRDLDIKQEVRDYQKGVSYPLEIIHHRVQQ